MKVPEQPTLILRMRESRLKKLAGRKPFVAASLNEVAVRCGRKGCHCAKGEGHPSQYLTLKQEGKTVTVYVPKHRLAEVREWVKEHRRIKLLLREISDLSLGLLRAEARRRKPLRRRSRG
jgi:hypothetical protein